MPTEILETEKTAVAPLVTYPRWKHYTLNGVPIDMMAQAVGHFEDFGWELVAVVPVRVVPKGAVDKKDLLSDATGRPLSPRAARAAQGAVETAATLIFKRPDGTVTCDPDGHRQQ
jgi:hypothetical protein